MSKTRVLAALPVLALLSASPALADIHVAVVGPMTGQYSALGTQMKLGAEQAVADINARGGVLGQKVVLEEGDDSCDPVKAVSMANQMAAKGVVMVDGHYCSGSSIPASHIYEAEGILEVSPASTNPNYTDQGSWNTFRLCGRDDQQGQVAAKFLADRYHGGRIAVIDDGTSYGRGLADQTRSALVALGIQPALVETYTPGGTDYSALVSRLKAANVAAVYLGGYYAEAATIVKAMRAAGVQAPLVGGDALVTDGFWASAGTAGAGTMMTFPADPRGLTTAAAQVKAFRAHGTEPEGYTLYAYAAIQAWAAAANKAGSSAGQRVATALKAGSWDTAIGRVAFDKVGDITTTGGWVMYEWRNGTYRPL
jgi:branched-chain amino acid transport system substrate-binding protein